MNPKPYRNYLLTVLTVLLVFNCIDRVAMGLVLDDIKADLQLSDTQLGLLTGIAFALFYSLMGVPIARWADRGNRIVIVSLTAAMWSVAVALCGTAGTFVQLLLIRITVAVGEAGCVPPAYSLIADYFSRAERPRAAAIYGLGPPLSTVVGYFAAGWLNDLYGWRVTFVVMGLPGLALAALAWFTLKEPRRHAHDSHIAPDHAAATELSNADSSNADQPRVVDVCRLLWANKTLRHLLLCFATISFFSYGIFVWLPAFLSRTHGLSSAQIGTWLALTYGLGGTLGAFLGGDLSSRFAARNEPLQLRVMAIAIAVSGILSVTAYLSSDLSVAFTLIGLSAMALTTVNGPLFAAIQTLVPANVRAVAFALAYLFANLVGMGLGPLGAGVLSDVLRASFGEDSLRLALISLSPGYLVCAWLAWMASKTVATDLVAIRPDPARHRDVDAPGSVRWTNQTIG